MTADVELLPLPDKEQLANPYAHNFGSVTAYGHSDETLTSFARANVLHHTAAQAAEIEALRADAERYRWLRAQNVIAVTSHDQSVSYQRDDLDAEVDRARGKEGGK